METFFAVGGIAFYALLAFFVVALLTSVNYDSGWWSTFITVGFFIALYFAIGFNVVTWTWVHPLLALQYVVEFLVCGVVWACVKMYFHALAMRDIARQVKVQFLNEYGLTTITEDKKARFITEVKRHPKYTDSFYPPRVLDHKADWLMWATYWPFSLVWTLIDQPLKKLWRLIYSYIGNLMQTIVNKMFEKV